MARASLGVGWKCLLANDLDRKKAETYKLNWGSDGLIVDDIRNILPEAMPGKPDLVWGSFPCQDLSLAGGRSGLSGTQSGAFWSLLRHINTLKVEGRAPSLIALENVLGTLTSNGGQDFTAICRAVIDLGYSVGAIVVDAVGFVPQSRPRLFMICIRNDLPILPSLTATGPVIPWHPSKVIKAYKRLPLDLQRSWHWWTMPQPPKRCTAFVDLIEEDPAPVSWDTPLQTRKLLLMMNNIHLQKVAAATTLSGRVVGTVFRRTRGEQGKKTQRAEIRFDGIAGCLRTPAGGSSRQQIIMIEDGVIRSRLMSPRETARLMGLPDTYLLPVPKNETYHLTGDGVVVPVVRYITQHLFEKLIS